MNFEIGQHKRVSARVGAELRAARKEAGLKQTEISSKLEISQSNLSRIENGKHAISVDLLVDVAYAMGVSPASILIQALQAEEADTLRGTQCNGNAAAPSLA